MSDHFDRFSELDSLLGDLRDDLLDDDKLNRLDAILANDPEAVRYYVEFIDLFSTLTREPSVWSNEADEGGRRRAEGGTESVTASAFPIPSFQSPISDSSVHHSSFIIHHLPYSSSFVGGVLFSYLVAVVILGTALAIAWAWKLPDYTQIAVQLRPSATEQPVAPTPKMQFVGQITGMVNCQWADATTATLDRAHVPLSRKYALASGLLEITYSSGAKVVLQGPATYEVESATGGFLSLGKLTARVEKRGERRGEREENAVRSTEYGVRSTEENGAIARRPSEIRNPKSEISPLSTLHSPLFAVRTPTATVTDLGTEFGVEVDKQGNTASRVYRGSVSLQVADGHKEARVTAPLVLRENESARVERSNDKCIIVPGPSAKPAEFVRRLVKPTIKTFDLVDVVAGGDGFSSRRNRGIDPANGQIVDARSDPPLGSRPMAGDGQYHRVTAMPYVDGVFIPDGSQDSVQVDSAGHVFDGFKNSAAVNATWQHVWAGGTMHNPNPAYAYPSEMDGIDYGVLPHGLLLLHANLGITFDLTAIRQANPGQKLLRFRAMAGNTETFTPGGGAASADVWVLVDGQIRYRCREINSGGGVLSVVFPITETDRFLTLVSTDGGDGIMGDWLLFGDPRLEMSSSEMDEHKAEIGH